MVRIRKNLCLMLAVLILFFCYESCSAERTQLLKSIQNSLASHKDSGVLFSGREGTATGDYDVLTDGFGIVHTLFLMKEACRRQAGSAFRISAIALFISLIPCLFFLSGLSRLPAPLFRGCARTEILAYIMKQDGKK